MCECICSGGGGGVSNSNKKISHIWFLEDKLLVWGFKDWKLCAFILFIAKPEYHILKTNALRTDYKSVPSY